MTTYPNLAKTVFAIFMVFVPILLLNMLIAMMGNTYAHVIEQSEKEWVKQVGSFMNLRTNITLDGDVVGSGVEDYMQIVVDVKMARS